MADDENGEEKRKGGKGKLLALLALIGAGVAAEDRSKQGALSLPRRIVPAHEPIDLASEGRFRCCHFRSRRSHASQGLAMSVATLRSKSGDPAFRRGASRGCMVEYTQIR